MKIVLKEIFNHPLITNGKNKIKEHIINADTLEECFKEIYSYERGSRYNNFVYHEMEDLEIRKQYMEWKKTGITVDLYYGGGVVD